MWTLTVITCITSNMHRHKYAYNIYHHKVHPSAAEDIQTSEANAKELSMYPIELELLDLV